MGLFKEIHVRKSAIRCSLLSLALALGGCDAFSGNQRSADAPVTIEQVHWTADTVRQLRQAVNRRAVHGLDHIQFAISGEPGSAAGDRALTQSALRYASALARGVIDPAKLFDIYTVPRPDPDLLRGLAGAMVRGGLNNWFDGLAPQDQGYRSLSKAYLAMRKSSGATSPPIPDNGEALKPGGSDPRIPAIAGQLAAWGYLAGSPPLQDRYTPEIARAVQHMQADYGIKPDGVIGSDTLEILNLSDVDRARALAVAMERLRWLVRNPPATRIDVNTASGQLQYWRDGKLADSRKVVVGKPGDETPQLGSPVFRLVANPTWTVPRSIQSKEIAGKGAGYLRRNNMVWKDGWIVQQAGPANSLGLVKFDMKNEHQIYLHDTPAKALFQQVQRQRSHGCVRVDDALGFAEILARDEGVLDSWHQARATGKETFVPLPREVPVRLIYQTVVFGRDGAPALRSDPYGWDDRVATALGFPPRQIFQLHPSGADIGP